MLLYSEDEVNAMTLKELKSALRKFEKSNELDTAIQGREDLWANADHIASCLILLEDRIKSIELGEETITPLGTFRTAYLAGRAHGVEEATIYYRMTSQPDQYRKAQ